MVKVVNRYGGGAQTNVNGLHFEQTTSLNDALQNIGYIVNDCRVYKGTEHIGMSVPQWNLYSKFLESQDINYQQYNSKRWLPDECFINFENRTAFIIEKKFQNTPGSVDEKLPGCHFKKLEYAKLFEPIGYTVEFLYVFNDWFLRPEYKDTLAYINSMGCYYCFDEIPLSFLGLGE